ncbi:DUF2167 domain-containing protein [Vibrio parahaemolyticus]|uniref:DUF2167 domain-containing protein n=1 Tax=Vibrio parahaemolyticus TaxID=670 RepID=UPI001EE9BB9A|nr:DUF2167 domain-containing protein [Vibrio parahaemolyticus]MCG6467244.1 DUF2167 domain-containing protein [Vibrio parahaemolyticus]MCG6490027.1 DUF2167 domain-containing protein [Vibrio parahaemolyticus]
MRVGLLGLLFLLIPVSALSESDNYFEQVQKLDWKTVAGSYDIQSNNAKVMISENEYLVLDEDAIKFMRLTEGHDNFKPDAVKLKVHSDESESTAIYEHIEIGFVKTDDWDEYIDPVEMLEQIKLGTEEANKMRAEGYAKLYIDGWLEPPFLDRENSIVYWAINGHSSDDTHFVNAKALKLGRKGYTEMIWAGTPEQFSSAREVLEPVLASYTYNEGYQYKDFVPGTDTVAAMGAGALVYKLATGKTAVKAGLLAAAVIFAKKFWFVLLIPIVSAWKWIKRKILKKIKMM